MATQTSVLFHTWTAAALEAAAAIETVHAQSGVGSDPSQAWSVLAKRAQAVIDLYDSDDRRLETCELLRVSQLLLRTAEEFRLLIESQHIPEDDPRTRLYDEFADRAELLALPEPCSQIEIDDPPFTLKDFAAALSMRT